MIVLYHENNKVATVRTLSDQAVLPLKATWASKALFEIAVLYPDRLIIWCHVSQKEHLNSAVFSEVFHHQKIMASFRPGESHFFSDAIGYVEQSPFIKVNKTVQYPTWQMSSCVGGIFASVLNALPKDFPAENDFDFFLNSLGKQAMPIGLLCYSEPRLLSENKLKETISSATDFDLFRFVKHHFKTRWVLLLFLNMLIYEKKLAVLPFFSSLFFRKRLLDKNQLDSISVNSSKSVVSTGTIDVIIPTIGRKKYLYDVLCDLKKQTHLPTAVIIVEQNPMEGSVSELDYLYNEDWPFKIDFTFTHQAGACNARNIALGKVKSEWVFFADDDIRLGVDFLKNAFILNSFYKIKAYSLACNIKPIKKGVLSQTTLFSSGCSIVLKQALTNLKFSSSFEFGFGEDSDFGMQLRNAGYDILYFPQPEALHLKAPIGGFRIQPYLKWENEIIQPKPSPTVMLYKLLHTTDKQIKGYKMTSFFKFYKHQKRKNPYRYYFNFQKKWERSAYWANELKLKSEK